MKLRNSLFVLFALLLLSVTVMAIDGETSNACDEGNFMDGQCNTTDADMDGDVDQQDIDWMWECGWWLMRVQSGDVLNDDVPLDGCRLPEREIPRPDKGSPYVPKSKSDPCAVFPSLDGLQAQTIDCCFDSPALDSPLAFDPCAE